MESKSREADIAAGALLAEDFRHLSLDGEGRWVRPEAARALVAYIDSLLDKLGEKKDIYGTDRQQTKQDSEKV